MKGESQDRGEGGAGGLAPREIRTCPVCGTKFTATTAGGLCPVCILRRAASGGPRLAEALDPASTSEHSSAGTKSPSIVSRFENYEVMLDEDGKPAELGRGAMGITYKAFDVDLRCPVTLKVISEKYVGDESARLRFLREARAAAKVRHANVASVFHLGRTGENYFYAMEFVEGETLENLIKRSGRLEVKLALEIVAQVAAGLAAVHEQKLVHRDIKPTNIMVSLKDDGRVTAKIIDLGLAKGVSEPGSESAISIPGAFAGTPEFASPEQFAGLGLDIRSDLYSLGVTLWDMMTGHVLFSGSPAEVMYQHQHTPSPVERLKDIPQPVVVLLEKLLKKDPAKRFRTPNELLTVIAAVMQAIEARRTVKPQHLRTAFVQKPRSRPPKLPAIRVAKRSIAVLPFSNLSDDKRNAYFADGVQDEILSNLTKISQLKVISRTSVMTYRAGGNRNLRSIASALGVVNVVEGTVRRDGNRVRISIRLVDARTDDALWSESYDRELTDIFAIQSEVAQTVASKLSAKLSPEERKRIAERPTNSLEAYDLYLQGKELIVEAEIAWENRPEKILSGIRFMEEAIRKDPTFALAYCFSARAHADLYAMRFDRTLVRRGLGDAAVSEALRLEPDLPEAHLTAAFHLFACYHDFTKARVHIAIAQRTFPNSPYAIRVLARVERPQGRWEESTKALEKACNLDPRNSELLVTLGQNYQALRRYGKADQIFDRLIELEPNRPMYKVQKAVDAYLRTGDLLNYRIILENLPSSTKAIPDIASDRFDLALSTRDWVAAKQILVENEYLFLPGCLVAVPRGCGEICLAAAKGEHPTMKGRFAAAREQLKQKVEANPEDPDLLSLLGVTDALLGLKAEAIQEAKRAVEMIPISTDAIDGIGLAINLAVVYAWTKESDMAFREFFNLAEIPNGIHYGDVKSGYLYEPLRTDPRFERLLAQLAPRE